jgi:hypothetical protein
MLIGSFSIIGSAVIPKNAASPFLGTRRFFLMSALNDALHASTV